MGANQSGQNGGRKVSRKQNNSSRNNRRQQSRKQQNRRSRGQRGGVAAYPWDQEIPTPGSDWAQGLGENAAITDQMEADAAGPGQEGGRRRRSRKQQNRRSRGQRNNRRNQRGGSEEQIDIRVGDIDYKCSVANGSDVTEKVAETASEDVAGSSAAEMIEEAVLVAGGGRRSRKQRRSNKQRGSNKQRRSRKQRRSNRQRK